MKQIYFRKNCYHVERIGLLIPCYQYKYNIVNVLTNVDIVKNIKEKRRA